MRAQSGAKNLNLSQSPLTRAIEHPEFAAKIREFESRGVKVVLDPTLELPMSDTAGFYHNYSKTIHISPRVKWHEFVHEGQHADFAQILKSDFSNLKGRVQSGESLSAVISDSAKVRYSKTQIADMDRLMKLDVSEAAVNESLSAAEQLKSLGYRRFGLASVERRSYGREFVIDSLKEIKSSGQANSVQLQALRRLQIRDKLEAVAESAVGYAWFPTVALGSIYFFVSNDEKDVIFRLPNNQWIRARHDAK